MKTASPRSSLRGALRIRSGQAERRRKPIHSGRNRFAQGKLLANGRVALSVLSGLLLTCATAGTWRDIPTYPGAEEVWGETRTGEVYMESRTYETTGSAEAVIAFYRAKMAELDWNEQASGRTRDGFLVRWNKQGGGADAQLQVFASGAGGVVVEITKTRTRAQRG